MSCVMHYVGSNVQLDELLKLAPVADCSVFRKGEPSSIRPSAFISRTSGIKFRVSDAEFEDLAQQQLDALMFLQKHWKWLN